jgi:hypothetical protein
MENKSDNFTFLILLFGIITSSLAHLSILICFGLYYLFRYRKRKSTIVWFLVLFAASLLVILVFRELFDTLLFSRLRYNSSTKRFSGDTRSNLFLNALELLDTKSFFWGSSKTVYTDEAMFRQLFPLISDNPLAPIVKYGFFSQWYYYFMLSIVFFAGLIQKEYFFIYTSICLLFFQRPTSHVISYNFYFVLFFLIAIKTIGSSRNKLGLFNNFSY